MLLRLAFLALLTIAAPVTAEKVIDFEGGSESQCPDLKECPYNGDPCIDEHDCGPTSSCCESPCGKFCTKQLYTGCETLRRAAARRAKALGVNEKGVRMPKCSEDGSFEPVQCNNEIVSSCWCVDEAGFELAGTRAPAAALVNCTAPKSCAAHTCRMFCPHGFALTADGCPFCRCRDLCEDIRCPDSLACHPEDLTCADPPCPPVPTCKRGRSLENICPVGDPLRISETVRPFLCGNEPSKPNCPPLYQCLVQPANEYGVCCPASLKIRKTGACPARAAEDLDCGTMCTHDLECASIQKCCETERCGSSCVHPANATECLHQRAVSELLTIDENSRGYVPQCSADGQFEPRQCSRNGLVCWCVDRMGRKLRGSMGPADMANCSLADARSQALGRSITGSNGVQCERLECAAICEYGFRLDDAGCPTCKCDDPCDGYACPEDEECVTVRDSACADIFCPTLPFCRPKAIYTNPCLDGTPLTDESSGAPIACALAGDGGTLCPDTHNCTAVPGSTQAVCCPTATPPDEQEGPERAQTMCEYLHGFSESMEGTRDGMTIAIPPPSCDGDGYFLSTQCGRGYCWCVDQFGTEIPKTRGRRNSTRDCDELRKTSECVDLTCRMGCDYGFVLDGQTGCPTCQCRDPCAGVRCGENEQCQLVEVSCKDHYCAPVPACLPKKVGQCPYIVPATSSSCEFECSSDLGCNGSMRCCSNGCGTQCTEPLLLTACQHEKLLATHHAHEAALPGNMFYIPRCREDGGYEPRQCHAQKRQCWCVDSRGFEISRTRTDGGAPPDCGGAAPPPGCPLYKCAEDCGHGFEIDGRGCRTCRCVDPCSRVSCREDGEACRLVDVECVDGPCPPVAMCLPKKENPCQYGEPLRLGAAGDDAISCGPDFESCPSSHKCQLSPFGEYAVCCPKPREVCFEAMDAGRCESNELTDNVTRYYFHRRSNKCEPFLYSGCQGNQNNFETAKLCSITCPVLSQCERLREKNQRQSERYRKPTFTPRCEKSTGRWQPVQCLEHVGVCWCVNPQGEALKGTVTRGGQPECNFRQARNRMRDRSDADREADAALEEIMMQLSLFDDDDREDADDPLAWELPLRSRCEALGASCDSNGQFLPSQCDGDTCWCVDEAGNQLPNTDAFRKGERLCLPTPVESVDIIVGFRGEYDDITAVPVVNQIAKIVRNLRGVTAEEGFVTDANDDGLYIKFSLTGSNKVDVAYRLEQMVTQQRLPGVSADITRSRFVHKLGNIEPLMAERIVSLEHREIVSQSPVSLIAHYHTALIVIAAGSAFIISVLTLLVILYRRKVANLNNAASKIVEDNQRFLSLNRPIYIELPNEKLNQETNGAQQKPPS